MAQANGEPTLQQRLVIVERAQAGESDAQIAQMLSYSVWTVRKWRRRERDRGRAGLTPQRGRPATGALRTASTGIREAIRTMRQASPGWGPETIRIGLGKDERFNGGTILRDSTQCTVLAGPATGGDQLAERGEPPTA